MNVIDDPDMNLFIPLKSIYEEFVCPICFDTIKECRMTPCGHNYCFHCITECLNLRHACPICSNPCTIDTVVENKQFDRLLKLIDAQKDKASKNYFEKLLKGDNEEPSLTESGRITVVPTTELSPIEQIFQKHMKKGLNNYQSYYDVLLGSCESKKAEITEKYAQRMNSGEDKSILKMEFELEIKRIESKFSKSISLLLDSYEMFMETSAPSPQFLPVTASIVIKEKNVEFYGISIDRTWTVENLRETVIQKMDRSGDPVVEFSDENIFVLFKSASDNKENGIILDEDIPIVQYNPEPGCLVELQGHILCKSDAPKVCFKSEYEEGALMDYFQCITCRKTKWICKNCAETCHADHELITFLLDHKPTYACCYCKRTKKCLL
eukprot:TRINITY_DN2516_c0_g2_i1.p1 TRINITY_DN2516_c0_g2~~TRINITY_DN2516_c0_g2_i1.p1  ORF type:complete len:391 (+),score=67.59 TRINITY_DN2516_c0_g2_i1:31-1173(+)